MLLALPSPSEGQEHAAPPAAAEHSGAELAKKLANPISDLVSVPFQFNWSEGVGPNDQTQFLLNVQPFLAYNTKSLWTITLQSETTANWKAEDDQWTVPINLLFAKLSSFGPFPASYQFGAGVFAARPDTGPKWKIRAAIVILLPRRK